MERRVGREGRRRKEKAHRHHVGTGDREDAEVLVVEDEDQCEDEILIVDEEVEVVKEPPVSVPDRAQRRLARDGVGRTEVLVTGLPHAISEAEVWMTVSMGSRDSPRPSRVEVMSGGREASALLGFKNIQLADKFRTFHPKGFLGGRLQVENHAGPSEKSRQMPSSASRSKSRSPRHRPPRKPKEDAENEVLPSTHKNADIQDRGKQGWTEQRPPRRLTNPKSTISVKSTIFLKGPSEDDINSVQEAVKGDRKPSLCMRKQSVEQMPETPWEPIIVDLVQTNGVITKVRVFRVTHNKVQDFFGQAPDILCKAMLKYVRRYFPVPAAQQLILLTLSPTSFDLLMSTLTGKDELASFHAVFTSWTCITWLVRPWARLRTLQWSKSLLPELIEQLQLPVKESEDCLASMGRLLEACMPDWNKVALPCTVGNIQDCRIVVLHVGVLQIVVNGVLVPTIGSLGFRTSDRGSWFVRVEPDEREGKVEEGTTSKLGLRRGESGRWVVSKDGSACLTEAAALRSLLDCLGPQQVVLITPSRSCGIEVLIGGLQKHNMADELIKKVSAVGCVEEMVSSQNLSSGISFSGVDELVQFCSEKIGRKVEEVEQVPRAILQLLEKMFPSLTADQLGPHLHPLVSPYTHSLLAASSCPHLLSSCNLIHLAAPITLQAGDQHLVTLRLSPSAVQDVGHQLTLVGDQNLELYSEASLLSSSLKVTATIRNAGSEVLKLSEGERVGLAWRDETELSSASCSPVEPESLDSQMHTQPERGAEDKTTDTPRDDQLNKKARIAAIRKEIAQLEAKLLSVEGNRKDDLQEVEPRKSTVLEQYLKKKDHLNQKKAASSPNKVSTSEIRPTINPETCKAPAPSPAIKPAKEEYAEARLPAKTKNHEDEDDHSSGEGSSLEGTANPCEGSKTKKKRIVLGKRKNNDAFCDKRGDEEELVVFNVDDQELELQEILPTPRKQGTNNPDTNLVKGKRVKLSFADESDIQVIEQQSNEKELQMNTKHGSKENCRSSKRRDDRFSDSRRDVEMITEIDLGMMERNLTEALNRGHQRPVRGTSEDPCFKHDDNDIELIEEVKDLTDEEKQPGIAHVSQRLHRKRDCSPPTAPDTEVIKVQESVDLAEEEDAIQILPVKQHKIHFVSGCAVADPESLRQSIEKYNRRKKEKAAAQALLTLAKQPETEASECALEILDDEASANNTTNAVEVDRETSKENEAIEIDVDSDKNGSSAERSKQVSSVINPECHNNQILELAPSDSSEFASGEERSLAINCSTENDCESTTLVEKKATRDEAKSVPSAKTVGEVGTGNQIDDDTSDEDVEKAFDDSKRSKYKTSPTLMMSNDLEKDETKRDERKESYEDRVTNQGGEGYSGQSDEDRSMFDDAEIEEAAYHDAYNLVKSISQELEMSSSDEESVECMPDLDSLVQFETKKKIDLRKQKPERKAVDNDGTRKTTVSKKKSSKPRLYQSTSTKRHSPWILTKEPPQLLTTYLSQKAKHNTPKMERLEDAASVTESSCPSGEENEASPRPVILEPRNVFNTEQDDTDHDDAPTAPNSDIDEDGKELQGEVSKRDETKVIFMEKPEENEVPTIQILNSKSVAEKERLMCGPINKVLVDGKPRWQCDICLKTIKAWNVFLEHLNGHYLVNSFFCSNCETSFKNQRNLTRHQKRCQAHEEISPQKDDTQLGGKNMDSGHEAFDEEEAISSRGNTPDLMMTNVTTLKPSDSEAAQIEEEEQQEDRTGNTHTCEKKVFDEINFKENEKDNDEDVLPRSGKRRIDLVKRELIDEVTAEDGEGPLLYSPNEEMLTDEETCHEDLPAESKEASRTPVPRNDLKYKRQVAKGSSPGTLIVRSKKARLTFVDDANVFQMESFHYKTLAEKLSTEIAIVKYVSARPDSKPLIQEKAKQFKREVMFPDEQISGDEDEVGIGDGAEQIEDPANLLKIEDMFPEEDESDDVNSGNNDSSEDENQITSNEVVEKMEGPAWDLPIDPARSVVSQLRILVKESFSSDGVDAPELCFDFPSLLTNPEFESLVQTYLRVLRIPLDKMSPAQQQFADTMVTELVTAGVSDLPSLTSIFKDLVVEMPGANMEVWVAAVEKKLPGLAMANVCDPTFTTAGFVVVVLVHCLLNV